MGVLHKQLPRADTEHTEVPPPARGQHILVVRLKHHIPDLCGGVGGPVLLAVGPDEVQWLVHVVSRAGSACGVTKQLGEVRLVLDMAGYILIFFTVTTFNWFDSIKSEIYV